MAVLRGLTPKNDSRELDAFNSQLRQSDLHKAYLSSLGYQPGMPVNLSGDQRKALKQQLIGSGVQFGDGMEIDAAGNINGNEGFWKQAKKWGPLVGGGAAMAFGIPGLMPGMIGGGGAGAAAASQAGTIGKVGAEVAPSLFGGSGGGSMGGLGFLGKIFGKSGIDPTTALLGGLSLFGGDEGQAGNPPTGFSGTTTNPEAVLAKLLSELEGQKARILDRKPALRDSYGRGDSGMGPTPVTIPGVPFQIGGGLSGPRLRKV